MRGLNKSVHHFSNYYDHLWLCSRSVLYSHKTPKSEPVLGDDQLFEGWYRFVGAAVTKMPTTRVPAFRCGTDWSGWLDGAHPTVEDDKFLRKIYFRNRPTGCKYPTEISVRNCGSHFIYKFLHPPDCDAR